MRRAVPALLLALASVVAPARADESAPPYLVRDTTAARQALDLARRALAAGETRRGVEGLQALIDGFPDDLVEVPSGDPARQALFVTTREAAVRELLALGPEGRAAYEEIAGPAARALLERAAAARDEGPLREAAARHGLAQAGGEALRRLADSALERGAARDAAGTLRDALRLRPRDAGLWLRLVDALEASRDAHGLAAARPPEGLTAATARGPVEVAARLAAARAAVGPPTDPSDCPGWDGGPRHDLRPSWDHDLKPLRWAVGRAPAWRRHDEPPFFAGGEEAERQAAFETRWGLAAPFVPVVAGRRVVVADGFGVAAHDILSGRLEWRFPAAGRTTPGLDLFSPEEGETLPGRTNLEVAHVACVDRGLVFASVEVQDKSHVTRRLNGIDITVYRPRRLLVALDAGTGALRWRMGGEPADAARLGALTLAGPPVAADGLVVAAMAAFEERWSTALVAFEAETGRVRWRRDLVTSQQELNLFGKPIKELWAGAPAVADGTVYATTGLGILSAVDLRTGEVRWSSSYASAEIERVEIWFATPMRLPTWGPSPVVVHGDAVFAAPSDSPWLHCFARSDGRLRWREASQATRDSARVDHFLGVAHDGKRTVALVTGRDLRALDAATGLFVWGARLASRGGVRGRGAVSRSRVYVPTNEGMMSFGLAGEGRLVPPGIVPWPEGAQPGNVVLAREALIVAGGASDATVDGLVRPVQAFYDPDDLEQEVEARRRAAPADPWVALEAADLARVVGRAERSAGLYEQAASLARRAGASAAEARAREGVHLLWRDRGDAFAARDRDGEALDAYGRAIATAQTAAERVAVRLRIDRLLRGAGAQEQRASNLAALAREAGRERAVLSSAEGETAVRPAARRLLAETLLEAERPAQAVDALMDLLREDPEAAVGTETAAEWAVRRIREIVEAAGPKAYERHEREAAARLAQALKSRDPEPFERLLAEYPNASAAREALLGLADRRRAAGDLRGAAAALRRFLTAYPEHAEAPRALASLARTLAAAGSRETARAALAALVRRHGAASFEFDGRTWTGASFAQAEGATMGAPPPGPPPAPLASRPEDRWTEAVEPKGGGARCVEVDGDPAAVARLPVLVDTGAELVAVDPARARARWRRPWDGTTRAVATGDSVVLGQRDALVAIDPETGESRWRRELPGDVVEVRACLGLVVVLLRSGGVVSRTRLAAVDPVTSDIVWLRDLAGQNVERLVAGAEGLAVLRRRTGGSGAAWVVTVHAGLTGEPLGEVSSTADFWAEGAPSVADGRFLLVVERDGDSARVRAFDLATAAPRWTRSLPGGRQFVRRHLLLDGAEALIVDSAGRVRGFRAEDGEPTRDTAVTGGFDTVGDRCAAIVQGRLVAVLRESRLKQSISAFDLDSGRALWSEPLSSVHQGLLLPAGDRVVAVLTPLVTQAIRGVSQPPEYQILVAQPRRGGEVVRITPRGLGGYPPQGVVQGGALVVAGQRGFAVYR